MKFTCDSCGAAYMISDDKVGPGGVKVRCKKCGNVVTVKRPDEPPVVAPAAASAAPPAGLDDELGNAFDHAFGDAPAPAEAAPAAAKDPAPAPAATAAPPATEWYVAIGEAQVGPLPLAEVKKKWEAGDVGPDSLVWRPGMGDWGPLSGVPDLAAYLSPVPQPAKPRAAPATAFSAAPVPAPAAPRAGMTSAGLPAAAAPVAAPAAAPAPEVEWKPAGASALAALASEEMASRDAAAATPATPRAAPARSLMEQMPDSGGVDPTGAIPLPIRGMEQTEERPVRRSSVARGAEEVRHKRTVRTIVIAVAVLAVVVVGAAVAVIKSGVIGGGTLVAAPPPPVAPPPAPPAPAPSVPSAPLAAAEPATPPPAAPPATPKAEPVAEPPAVKEPPRTAAKPAAAPASPKTPAAKPPTSARAEAGEPAPKPERPAAPAKKKDVLDFDGGGDDDLAAALGGGGATAGKGSVYVPPKPGAAVLADRLTDGQITETVKGKMDDLKVCMAKPPPGHGALKVAWTIQPDGSPKDVRSLTPELASSEFSRCITGVVRSLRFPKLGDAKGQPVTFPFGY
jgi:predicted Zn finger-like uncharacterized protein